MAMVQPAPRKHWMISALTEPVVIIVLAILAIGGVGHAAKYANSRSSNGVIVANADNLAATCPVGGEAVPIRARRLEVTPPMRNYRGIVPVMVPDCPNKHLATREGREKALEWYKNTGKQTDGDGPGQAERNSWNAQLKQLRLAEKETGT